MIGIYLFLGVFLIREVMLYVIFFLVGLYFFSGLKLIKFYVEIENVRVFFGGVGDNKIGGNYVIIILF